jgi:hypothetical protein
MKKFKWTTLVLSAWFVNETGHQFYIVSIILCVIEVEKSIILLC